jgi:malate dehydrogenase (oxaloacetate-decarboxylating)
MNIEEKALQLHEKNRGKIEVVSKVTLNTREDLSIMYTPGVAEPCKRINENMNDVYKYTSKGNLVAVVTDGTAVLGLGDIGPEAAIPVMEGKAILFKKFANIDAIPLSLSTKNVDEIVKTIKYLEPTFGGINLEDISSPRCFEIETRLKEELNIPVFHDDQHGTAIVVSAGLINALKLVNKKPEDITVVVNGPGAAGTAIIKMLINLGVEDIIVNDKDGIICEGDKTLEGHKKELSLITNKNKKQGSLKDAVVNADVFIGVSVPNILTEEMIHTMKENSIIFALANPIPEIHPNLAKKAGARVVATGRSDFPNQVNNVLAFPGIFRGALDVRATNINEAMKLAAAYAIANVITKEELNEDYIIPDPFDGRVVVRVAEAVSRTALESGAAMR